MVGWLFDSPAAISSCKKRIVDELLKITLPAYHPVKKFSPSHVLKQTRTDLDRFRELRCGTRIMDTQLMSLMQICAAGQDGMDADIIANQIFERRKKRDEVNSPEYWHKGKCNRYPKTAVLVEKQDSIK